LRLDYPEFAGQVQQLTESLQLNELTAWLKQLSTEIEDAA
jgi:hypothetical protein